MFIGHAFYRNSSLSIKDFENDFKTLPLSFNSPLSVSFFVIGSKATVVLGSSTSVFFVLSTRTVFIKFQDITVFFLNTLKKNVDHDFVMKSHINYVIVFSNFENAEQL